MLFGLTVGRLAFICGERNITGGCVVPEVDAVGPDAGTGSLCVTLSDFASAMLRLRGRLVPPIRSTGSSLNTGRPVSSSLAKQGVKFSLSSEVVGKCGKVTVGSVSVGVGACPKWSLASAVVGDCAEALSTSGRNKNLGVATVGDVGLRSSAIHCLLYEAGSAGSVDISPSLSAFSCFSNSNSWPKKLKFGEMVGRLSFTYLYASSVVILRYFITYAIANVADREIPARQCTRTRQLPSRTFSKNWNASWK